MQGKVDLKQKNEEMADFAGAKFYAPHIYPG